MDFVQHQVTDTRQQSDNKSKKGEQFFFFFCLFLSKELKNKQKNPNIG